MATNPKPPGVYVTERSSGVRMIVGVGTSTPAFLGYTKLSDVPPPERPTPPFTVDQRIIPQPINGWQEFVDRYSIKELGDELAALLKKQKDGTLASGDLQKIQVLQRCFTLAEAVYGFFANGGTSCYVVGFLNPDAVVTDTGLGGDAEARTGLGGLETVPEVTMVAVPSLWDMTVAATDAAAPPPPVLPTGKVLIDKVLAHCTQLRNRLAVVDAPPGQLVEPLKTFVDDQLASPDSVDAEFTALYYPWVEVAGVDGVRRTVPPSGHLAGVWARTDSERGVFKAPANQNLRGVLSIPTLLTDDQNGALNDKGVNCLRVFPGRGLLVWGARTRSSSRDWKYLNVRRLVSFLSDSIRQSSTWAVFEPNDDRLWATLRHSVVSFLTDQWRQGALLGRTPDEAFYVICDRTNNLPETIDAGKVICDIGVAPVRPAEFVHFTITQIAGQPGQSS
ncbi:phage tail sheath family protein [Streptoverticillium reticulum]|uniref:phage tail sheath family protein n=1 Tax=Streptoverticillium reticulum TaxID=1433415 RepID=UPI0039BF25CE